MKNGISRDMSKFSLEAKLGIFVLAAVAIAVYTSFRVIDVDTSRGYPLKARFSTVEGLNVDTRVYIAGIKVGKVSDITLDPDSAKAIVTMQIDDAYKDVIPVDSRVILRTKGLMGDKYVAIEPGKPNARKLEAGDEIKLVHEPTDSEKILETVGLVAQDMQRLTREASKQLIDEKGSEQVQRIVNNTEDLTRNLREIVGGNRTSIDRTISNADDFVKTAKDMLAQNRNKIERTVDRFDNSSSSIDDLIAENKESLNETIENFHVFSANIDETGRKFGALADEVRGMVRDVKSGRGTLGRLVVDQEMYFEARRAIRNMNKTAEDVSEATPISTLAIILGSVFK